MDTEGHRLRVFVHEADVNDREGARWIVPRARARWPELKKRWVDQGYTGERGPEVLAACGIALAVVTRPADAVGFVLVPRRWVAERTWGNLGRCRRLSKDYEALPEYRESWVYIASIQLLLRRIAPDSAAERPYARKAS